MKFPTNEITADVPESEFRYRFINHKFMDLGQIKNKNMQPGTLIDEIMSKVSDTIWIW